MPARSASCRTTTSWASPRPVSKPACAISPTITVRAASRVNAISAGPVRTLAGAGISDARHMFSYQQRNSPLRRTVTIDEVGGSALYLLSDLSSGVTGEIHYVDSGYHIVSMPTLDELEADGRRRGMNRTSSKIGRIQRKPILRSCRARRSLQWELRNAHAVSNPNRTPAFRLHHHRQFWHRQFRPRTLGPEASGRRSCRHTDQHNFVRSSPRSARWPPPGRRCPSSPASTNRPNYVFNETHFDKLTGLLARAGDGRQDRRSRHARQSGPASRCS